MKRCQCEEAQPIPIEVDSKSSACGKCGGWFTMVIHSAADLDAFVNSMRVMEGQ